MSISGSMSVCVWASDSICLCFVFFVCFGFFVLVFFFLQEGGE